MRKPLIAAAVILFASIAAGAGLITSATSSIRAAGLRS